MKVLVACEFSGRVRDAFIQRGHDAISCDLLPTETPGPHYQGDVLDIIDDGFDFMIAHPPCTYLCNSGVCWLHKEPGRWKKMEEAARFFKRLLESDIPKIVIENPVMHRYALEIVGSKYSQTIQPWQFGHDASKRTCLWLKGLPLLKATKIIKKNRYANQTPSGRCKLPPSVDRWKLRSVTYSGIAEALAAQYG